MYDNAAFSQTFLFLVAGVLVCIFLSLFYFCKVVPFLERRRYIQMEIHRSDGEERKYWEQELKKLYISQIPFAGSRKK